MRLAQPTLHPVIRFGVFDVDPDSGELRKRGVRVKLQAQPFRILLLLLERPGEIVPREVLYEKLWSSKGTFVEFEHSLNVSIAKLRQALGDSAENPRFIETLSRRGYRFIASGEVKAEPRPVAEGAETPEVTPAAPNARRMIRVGLAVALPLFTAAWWSLSRVPVLTAPHVVSITTDQGVLVTPALSPDGRQIAYAWDGGKYTNPPGDLYPADRRYTTAPNDIYVKLIGSPDALRLTTQSGVLPVWSPDGRQIAFRRQFANSGRWSIYVVSSLGGAERKLADVPSMQGRFSWSADGLWLAVAQVTAPPEPNGIFLISTDGAQRRRLTKENGQSYDSEAIFSPNGKRLAYNACSGRVCTLSYLELDHDLRVVGPPHRLNAGMLFRSDLAWSSDSMSILYDRKAPHWTNINTDRLWRIGIQPGSRPQRLEYTEEGAHAPSTSVKGDRVAYAQSNSDFDIWKWQDGKSEKLIASTKVDESPEYSPNGSKIAFSSIRSGSYEIWLADADGSNQVQLTFSSIASGSPTWSPDGKWIVYDGLNSAGGNDIFVIGAEGGRARQITGSFDSFRPRFSRDGKWVYFTSDYKGISNIYRVPFDGGEPLLVLEDGAGACESWDGTSLYYGRGRHLYVRALNSNQETKVADLAVRAGGALFAIARDGVYYIGPSSAQGRLPLEFFDPATSKSREIATLTNLGVGLSVSPDGSIAFVVFSLNTRDDLRLVEDFR